MVEPNDWPLVLLSNPSRRKGSKATSTHDKLTAKLCGPFRAHHDSEVSIPRQSASRRKLNLPAVVLAASAAAAAATVVPKAQHPASAAKRHRRQKTNGEAEEYSSHSRNYSTPSRAQQSFFVVNGGQLFCHLGELGRVGSTSSSAMGLETTRTSTSTVVRWGIFGNKRSKHQNYVQSKEWRWMWLTVKMRERIGDGVDD